MKRLHVHVAVDDLATSIAFYSGLFAAPPSVLKPDYAKWMLDDPRVNFAISMRGAKAGLDHLGIQAETSDELGALATRMSHAGHTLHDVGAATCCYAQSDKAWLVDPSGLRWEAFHTTGESTSYSAPQAQKTSCCGPTSAKAATASCC